MYIYIYMIHSSIISYHSILSEYNVRLLLYHIIECGAGVALPLAGVWRANAHACAHTHTGEPAKPAGQAAININIDNNKHNNEYTTTTTTTTSITTTTTIIIIIMMITTIIT